MTVKGKDFKRAVEFIRDFLGKLPRDAECAALRDSLNLTLLHMKKYFQLVWLLNQENTNRRNEKKALSASLPRSGGRSPSHGNDWDQFHWRWFNLEPSRVVAGSLPIDDRSAQRLPLILQASKEGDVELVNQLIDKDPSCVNSRDALGRSAIMYAVQFGSDDCLEAMLKRGAHVNEASSDGVTAAQIAVIQEDGRTLRLLVEQGADLTMQDSLGRTAIHWAATLALDECLQVLIKCNIPLKPRDNDGLTPAMWACRHNRKGNFELLVGAELYTITEEEGIERDNRGRTWIHWSVDSLSHDRSCDCLKSLLSLETASIQDCTGKAALHLAAEIGSVEACKVILTDEISPSVINMTDNEGRTSLHLAVLDGHGEVANLLLERGADLDLMDRHGYAAIDYAKEKGLHYCTMILRSHEDVHKRMQKNKLIQSNKEVKSIGKPPSLSNQSEGDRPPPSSSSPLFSSVPPPRPSLAPKLSNLTRLEDLDREEGEEAGGDKLNGSGDNMGTREENRAQRRNYEADPEGDVQYVEVPEGGIVQSAETGIIGSDMQPSAQLEELVVTDEGDVLQQLAGSTNPDSLGSNQSLDFGMDVSDIEENNNNEKGRRLEGKSLEMIPSGLLAQQSTFTPEGGPHPHPKIPRPPVTPGPTHQESSEMPQPVSKSGSHLQGSEGSILEVPAVDGERLQSGQPPSPRRLTPLGIGDPKAATQVKGELKSKKKKKKSNKAASPRFGGGNGRLMSEYPGGHHPPVRPPSPAFPLPSTGPAPTVAHHSHVPLSRGRPERPSTPPPPPSGPLMPKRHNSPSPPVTPRDQLRAGPSGPVKGLLSPVIQPPAKSPTAPLAPKMPLDIGPGRGQPFMPTPPGGRSPRH